MAYDDCRIIQIFLSCVAGIFLCAFTSLYSQIPGLYGENGIYPAAFVLEDKSACVDKFEKCHVWSEQQQCKLNSVWMLENCAKSCNSCKVGFKKFLSFPTLLWTVPKLGLTTETGMELICLIGIFLSFFMLLSRPARDCLNFVVLGVLYYSLAQVGQIFLYYQWDNLLIETCFYAAILAPWNLYLGPWNIYKCHRVRAARKEHDNINFWLVKWLLFRLMFASGVVKLLWMDEAWWNLTALNWHYESQCIPNAVAWYMQKLPIPIHRLSVVITYLIEIVVPFLFFVPFKAARKFAFYAQMLLQVMIMATGNYNFFNLLTMALCLSLLEDDDFVFNFDMFRVCMTTLRNNCLKIEETNSDSEELDKEAKVQYTVLCNDDSKPLQSKGHSRTESSIWKLALGRFWNWSESRFNSKKMIRMKYFIDKQPINIIMKVVSAVVICSILLTLSVIAVKYFGVRFHRHVFLHAEIQFTQRHFLNGLFLLVKVATIVGTISLSVEILAALAGCLLKDFELPVRLVSFFQCLFFSFLAIWIFGLTLMPLTDLDAKAHNAIPNVFQKQYEMVEKFKTFNAYGLFRSMTGIGGRPEVVIMGGNSLDKNATWKEYNFVYKPGNLYSAPAFTVPHQPRLDWQMWFASLEDYTSNPWFINLCYKLLLADQSVLDLMASNPFQEKPPKYIRSVLFRYHYSLNHTGFWSALFRSSGEKKWWTRDYVDEYMPIVSKNDTGLLKLLHGYRLIRSERTKESHHGVLHFIIVTMRRIVRPFRPELLIYMKFAFLLAIFAFRYWWKIIGIPSIQSKRQHMDNTVKTKIDKIVSKLANYD